jgi:type I restriction enzyme M protein
MLRVLRFRRIAVELCTALKDEGKEYCTLKLYGQEINLLTSAIACMNTSMHGIDEFDIVRGDTLESPGLLENDELKKFNFILANPPYSIKSWKGCTL